MLRNGVTQIDLDYPFFMIDNAEDLQDNTRKFPHEGILGLSPDVKGDDLLTLGVPMPLHLYKKKRIGQPVIGLDMKLNGKSTIQIGKIEPNRFRNKLEDMKNLGWVNVNETGQFKWRALMLNVYYKRTEFADLKYDDDEVVDDGKKNIAIFDSFYPGIHLPIIEWKRLYELETKVLAEKNITLKCNFQSSYSCFFEGPCEPQHFEAFAFNFVGDRAYVVYPKDYLISTTNKNG
jgi:hypothetical protein